MPIEILMPALSPTMTEGTIAKWIKQEGDTVESGDVLCEIETDKATMEVEAVEEGTLGKILQGDGTEGVAVNAVIALLLEEGEDASALDGASTSAAPAPAAAPAPEAAPAAAPAPAAPAAAPAPAAPAATGDRVFASPLAKRLAAQNDLDLKAIAGTGPRGRVVKRDIEAALAAGTGKAAPAAAPAAAEAPKAAEAAPGGLPAGVPADAKFTQVPNSNMRKVIARRLAESKATIPHWYLTVEIELDNLLDLRKTLNAKSPEGEGAFKISVNDMIIKACGLALRAVPECNTTWDEEGILFYDTVDISIAVATPTGLITPIVRDADTKGFAAISKDMKDLGKRAKEGKLLPHEFQGGGFSISNLGMFGVKEFAPIVNPPQTAILGVSAGEQRPVVKDGALAIATTMNCTLSSDHRVVDGAVAAQFMQALKGFIEDPMSMML